MSEGDMPLFITGPRASRARETALLEAVREAGLSPAVSSQDKVRETLMELTRKGNEPAVLVMMPSADHPLALARRLYKEAPTSQFIFVVFSEDESALRRQMMFAPLIGNNWTILPPDANALLSAVQQATQLAKRRRQLRTTLDHFNVRLTSEPARDTEDYRKLVISDRHLASILEHAHDMILTLDKRGVILSWNDGAVRQYGRDKHEVLGQAAALLVVPQQQHTLHTSIQQVFRENQAVRSGFTCLRKNGSVFHAELSFAPVRDEQGRVLAVSLIGRDVTERVQAEQELERRVAERTRQLEAANKELEAFSYTVSHDLRAPLRSINGFSQALLQDYGDTFDEVATRYLHRIVAGAERMGELIDDLLEFSRVIRSSIHREPIDLSAMAKETMAYLQEGQLDRVVDVTIAEGLQAQGDAHLLRIVLDNLLGNAWKYTRNQPRPCIGFRSQVVNGETIYSVEDNGIGFDMRYANKLFQPFQRLHDRDAFEGTGIGLATVQRIIQRHGGRIWAESSPNEGATFYFTLNDNQHEELL